ncbi:MAG: prepilin-type N-terminal cleavage/methylation domain-containing protein [Nitrospinaceae bacterium]|nr:type II secretion system protein [Nitrospinaceae bacterium]NIR53787.1 type II secretion system protein [Nitrospinaceae bacterium]NIT81003.1 type II secretion system protein [Nitrospinaceae bacterium]NIU43293.1 type II secretion system protein [Nitrospinaceae bacterium]NIU95407.1 prepilin-type N-terminal cleavage/methylation domain-containing protein [Nitrospinaceae bacterium]
MRYRSGGEEGGFTLIELIAAIVLIGIAVPALFVPFSGLSESKHPESRVQASFWGLRQMEAISGLAYAGVPAAGSYSCAAFQAATVPEVDCSSPDYNFTWRVEDVAAADPDTAVGAPDFAKKVTLTVTRTDGAIGALDFYTLFAL